MANSAKESYGSPLHSSREAWPAAIGSRSSPRIDPSSWSCSSPRRASARWSHVRTGGSLRQSSSTAWAWPIRKSQFRPSATRKRCAARVARRPVAARPTNRSLRARRRTDRAPVVFQLAYVALLARATPLSAPIALDAEDVVLILYAPGAAGLPKGAVIGDCGGVAGDVVVQAESGVRPEGTFDPGS